MQSCDFPLDESRFVLPIEFQQAQRCDTPAIPFESKILAEREGAKERAIQELYEKTISCAAFQANSLAYLVSLIEQRGINDNSKPVDGVIARLKNELGLNIDQVRNAIIANCQEGNALIIKKLKQERSKE